MVRRGCALSVAVFAALFALYVAFFSAYFEWPGNLIAAGLGALFAAVGVGGVGHIIWAWWDTRAFARADRGEAPAHGQLVVAAGQIRPLGMSLTSPFGGEPCVAYEYEVYSQLPARRGRTAYTQCDLSGFAMAASAIGTPHGSVRLLGFPILDQFRQERANAPEARARARQYAASTEFEQMQGLAGLKMFAAFDDALADADGTLRKDFRLKDEPIPFDRCALGERIVQVGQQVCALGLYDGHKRALVPRGATLNRLWPGTPREVRSRIVATARSQARLGLTFFAVSHAMLGAAFYMSETRHAREPENRQASAIRQALQDRNVSALERAVRRGANPNARDLDGRAPLLDVREPAMAAALIRLGADVDVRDPRDGETLLIRAARYGDVALVRVLLDAGASPHAESMSGATALAEATRSGHDEVATLLCEAAAMTGSVSGTRAGAAARECATVQSLTPHLRDGRTIVNCGVATRAAGAPRLDPLNFGALRSMPCGPHHQFRAGTSSRMDMTSGPCSSRSGTPTSARRWCTGTCSIRGRWACATQSIASERIGLLGWPRALRVQPGLRCAFTFGLTSARTETCGRSTTRDATVDSREVMTGSTPKAVVRTRFELMERSVESIVRLAARNRPVGGAAIVASPACRAQSQAAASSGVEQQATLGRDHPADGDEMNLSSEATAILASVFRSLGLDAKQAGTAVTVAGTQVSVASRINNKVQQANRHLLAAEFDISVGGIRLPELLTGAIGIGDSPDSARNTAVAEWATQYGIPIGFAVGRRVGASRLPAREDGIAKFYAKVEVDGQLLFHGPVGLRGAAKAPEAVSSDEFVRRIATPVAASMRQRSSSGEYRSATVQIVVNATAVTDGECRVDGVVAADLLKTLSKLTWPEGSPSYMFKLFFVGLAGGS